MKKNGFVSTSVIYSFFILFILLMTLLLGSYSNIRILLEEYKNDIKNTFADDYIADVSLYIYVNDGDGNGYSETTSVPTGLYSFNSTESKCSNGSSISFNGTSLVLTMNNKDTCYAYFDIIESDIIVLMYYYNSDIDEYVQTYAIPPSSYLFQDSISYCEVAGKDAIEINEDDSGNRTYTISADGKDTCYLYFALDESDLILHIYEEVSAGTSGSFSQNDTYYLEILDGIPNTNKYEISSWYCQNNTSGATDNTEVGLENGELYVEAYHKDECYVYFNKSEPTITVNYYMESSTGVSGYTTGVTYTSTSSIPSSSTYTYAGTKCVDAYDGTSYYDYTIDCSGTACVVDSEESIICSVYFDKIPAVIDVTYKIEDIDGTYYEVDKVPSIGYVYNSSLSSCTSGGTISVNGTVVTVTNDVDDTCTVYFDLTTKDITVLVYVYDYSEGKYVLSSDIPSSGYAYKSYSCTNGATITYSDSRVIVATENPTVCEVYFGGS